MNRITANDSEAKSADLIAQNILELKKIFPDVFAEGKIKFDVLQQLLGTQIEEGEERYGLNWHGKRKARQLALTPSLGTLRPVPEDSVDWDSTLNLMIEGDNLEVLKLLQKSYAGKVKLIYIDPPYNTGKDFVYPDDFNDGIGNYMKLTGQSDEDGKLTNNPETSGRFHTNWLNMMYPRLKLARDLLKDDGVILIHIDEHELANLEIQLSEIFGEENHLGVIVWDKRNPKGDATGIAAQHEYLVLFAKSTLSFIEKNELKRPKQNATTMIEKAKSLIKNEGSVNEKVRQQYRDWLKAQDFSGGELAYSLIDESGKVYRPVSMAWPNKKEAPDDYFVPLIHPITKKKCPVPERGWRNPPQTMKALIEKGQILFGSDETIQPQRKYVLEENMFENVPSLLYYGGSDDSLLSELNIPFDTPKVVEVARRFIESIAKPNDIILDFFAGSGTTGHAVMAQNAEDGGNRRFILVQLPEPLDPNNKDQKTAAEFCKKLKKPLNIAELTKERLRRAAKKIADEQGKSATIQGKQSADSSLITHRSSLDFGFRVFRLDSSNIRAWNPDAKNLEQTLLSHVEHLVEGRNENDLLYEILLKKGLDLCVPMSHQDIAGFTVHSIAAGTLLACVGDKKITSQNAEDLALGIVEWKKTLTAEQSSIIFRDSAFQGDVAKSNLTAILEQHGFDGMNIKSL